MTGGVAFVASTDTHVDQFFPVMADLEGRGVATSLASLDTLYNQGATARASALGVRVEPFVPNVTVASSFYRRPVVAIWRDVLRCRRPISDWLRSRAPEVVVLGNDRGLVEKLVLATAHRQGRRVVLVQDGVLAPVPPRPANWRRWCFFVAKQAGSAVLRQIGLSYLSASHYGEGGADLVCASGPHGAETFRQLGVSTERIIMTGQPRFDGLHRAAISGEQRRRLVVAFSTPFKAAGIGADLQDRQTALLAGLARELVGRGIAFRVKPHPRESAQAYAEALGDPTMIIGGSSGDALRRCVIAVVGMSTVVDEAGLCGVPVVVPGQVVHAGRLDHHLPPADRYPRFESAREGAALIASLLQNDLARADLQRRQKDVVSGRIFMDLDRSATMHVADAICSVLA